MTPTVSESHDVPFAPEEVRGFDRDDAEAGQAIGKMLSLFFLYTVIVMAVSCYATYSWVTSSHPSLN
ncbi:MAG: hypothetical protein KDA80_13555 [Planctomycetaceae bacterium]|nr:hypothetical protein [Planctomycetaceae bacterium]